MWYVTSRRRRMILIVHGGAGNSKPKKKSLKKIAESLAAGYKILRGGGTALDSVIESIALLEDSGFFNAGSGGNLQLDGVRRLDASVMEGSILKVGAVIGIEGTRNPIRLARIIMDLPNVTLTNTGARKIAEAHRLARLPEPDETALRRLERESRKEGEVHRIYEDFFSTVGAVALDGKGTLAAGSSTGGIRAMLPGRVGDTPIIGAGVYAENPIGAVACTGKGESILRLCLAKELCVNMKEMAPLKAARLSLARLLAIEGRAGVIAINGKGQCALLHSTPYLAAGYVSEKRLVTKEGFTRFL
jgi:beta-aspartyl-peptidase (threonine type)